MNIRLFHLVLLLSMVLDLHAQELTVKSFSEAAGDLSASKSENRRVDKSGGLCGLVKVQLPLDGVTFDGAFVIGDVQRKADGYWVYMNKGAYQLHIMHPSFHPLELNLRELQPAASEGFRGVQPLGTYKLVVNVPNPTDKEEKKQKLIINYTPKNAMVLIDSKPCSNNGRAETELPLGEHSYIIAADGYITAEGKVTLNGGNARTLTEQLEKDGDAAETEMPSSPQNATTPVVSVPASSEGTFTVNDVSFRMVRVEGGTFQMGSKDSEADSDEKRVHQVSLSTFSIGETEVTQELWQAVMGSNPSGFNGAKRPVQSVSWEDCQQFIQKLNELTGKRFRLPTEAEWEYAARGGSKSLGYKYAGGNDIGSVAWYYGNSGRTTHDVATKQANELGLYDMSGNVWEWCQDWYDKYTKGGQTNPTGARSGSRRVYRGGSWSDNAWYCRSSCRYDYTPSLRYNSLGLRLAL